MKMGSLVYQRRKNIRWVRKYVKKDNIFTNVISMLSLLNALFGVDEDGSWSIGEKIERYCPGGQDHEVSDVALGDTCRLCGSFIRMKITGFEDLEKE